MKNNVTSLPVTALTQPFAIELADGEVYQGADPLAVVEAMRQTSFVPGTTAADFITATEARLRKFNGIDLGLPREPLTARAFAFLLGLQTHGLARRVRLGDGLEAPKAP